jgi:hypothetical protein
VKRRQVGVLVRFELDGVDDVAHVLQVRLRQLFLVGLRYLEPML